MSELLTKVFDARGGLERWREYERVDAMIVSDGFFPLKGVPQDSNPRRVMARGCTRNARPFRPMALPIGGPCSRRAR
jgi:hypothetical protein